MGIAGALDPSGGNAGVCDSGQGIVDPSLTAGWCADAKHPDEGNADALNARTGDALVSHTQQTWQVGVNTAVTYLNAIEVDLAEGTPTSLSAGTSIGATTATVKAIPTGLQVGSYIGIGAGTSGCEVRRVTAIATKTLTLSSALKVAHSTGDNVWTTLGFWVPFEWWGANADNATDSYRPLVNALLDQSISNYYGLVGRGATAYLSSGPLFQQDYTAMAFAKLQAFYPFSLDPLTTTRIGIPDQPFFTLAGQLGTATFAASTDIATFTINPGGAQWSDVQFFPRPGSTMPGGIEEGRRYYTITGNSLTTQLSAVYGSSTPVDITSNGSGEIVVVSTGASRLMWKNVMLHGNSIKGLCGLSAFLQQPSICDSVRIEQFPVIGASVGGQQATFPNLMIFDCWKGLEVAGAEFCYFPQGNIESCDINCDFTELDRMPGGVGENFGNVFGDFHWESPGLGAQQIQTLNRTGTPSSGTFQLRFKNVLTSTIDWNSTAAQLQTILEAHAAIGVGNVTCTQLSGTNLSDGPVKADFTVGSLKWEFWSGSTNTRIGGAMAVVNSTLVGGTMTISYVSPNARNISYKRGISNRFSGSVFSAVPIDPSGYNAAFIKTEGTANDAATGKNHGYHITDLFTSISTLANLIDDSLYGILLNSKDADANGVSEYIAEFIRPSRHGSTIGQHWWFVGEGGRKIKMNTSGKATLELIAGTAQTDNALTTTDVAGANVIEATVASGAGGLKLNTAATIRAGSGVPSNGLGANGDFYFRTDTPGTANQRLYVRSAGAYIGIV
jgi:hypothetical protein